MPLSFSLNPKGIWDEVSRERKEGRKAYAVFIKNNLYTPKTLLMKTTMFAFHFERGWYEAALSFCKVVKAHLD